MSNNPWGQQSQDDGSYQPPYSYIGVVTSSGAQPMTVDAQTQAQAQHSYLGYSQTYDHRSTLAAPQIQQPLYNYGAYGQEYANNYMNQVNQLQYRTAATAHLPNHDTVTSTQPYASSSHQGHHSSMSSLTDEHNAAYDIESLSAEPLKDLRCFDHGCNGRAFSTHSNLLRHQREKSGKSLKYTCPNCQSQFTRNTAMKAHMDDNKCAKKRSSSAT